MGRHCMACGWWEELMVRIRTKDIAKSKLPL